MNKIPRKAQKMRVTVIDELPNRSFIAERDEYGDWVRIDEDGKRWILLTSVLKDSEICELEVLS